MDSPETRSKNRETLYLVVPHVRPEGRRVGLLEVEALRLPCVVEVDAEAGEDLPERGLGAALGGAAAVAADDGLADGLDRVARQRHQELGGVRVVHHGHVRPHLATN